MGFLTFSQGIEIKNWAKMGFLKFSEVQKWNIGLKWFFLTFLAGIEMVHWAKMSFVTLSGV